MKRKADEQKMLTYTKINTQFDIVQCSIWNATDKSFFLKKRTAT